MDEFQSRVEIRIPGLTVFYSEEDDVSGKDESHVFECICVWLVGVENTGREAGV